MHLKLILFKFKSFYLSYECILIQKCLDIYIRKQDKNTKTIIFAYNTHGHFTPLNEKAVVATVLYL